ncbi:MarR family transcriptional regulator [Nocardia pneumoniae]|uniref:MarR family transcriptional regulator n=1 Tax=Nocardia pneumoniae TaxID=228601 RepID=UPI0012F68A33|nr:MarR family transcriptional regulator [Nocardia pneumoniae]
MSTRKKKTPVSKRPTPAPASDPTPDPATGPAPAAPVGEQGSEQGVGVPVLRTDTEKALWAALGNHPGFTTDELAGAAGISGSTARRILSGWETAGAARSHRDPESARAAKTWTTAEQATTEPAESAATEPVAAEPTEPATVTGAEPAAVEVTEPDHSAPADPGPDTGQPDTERPETAVAAPTGDESADPAPDTPAPTPDAAAAQPESTERLAPGALRGQVEDFLRDHPGEEYTPHQIGKALDRSSGAVHNALVKLTTGGTARQTCAAPKKFALATA